MSKIAIITAALVGVGFGVQVAVEEAERIAPRLLPPTKKTNAGRPPKGGDGFMPTLSVNDRIRAFAEKKKGNVWSLSSLALATKVDKNVLSTNLTHLVKSGFIRRTGRAEYVKN